MNELLLREFSIVSLRLHFFFAFFFCVFTLIIFNYDLTEARVCLEDAKSLLERKNKNICLVKLENDKPEDSLTSFKTPIDNQFDACVYVLMIIEKNKGCNLPLEKNANFTRRPIS